ncbi:MAG: hypothetical protein ACR2IN_03475 [Thermoleophilaceae bacterium]|jgi:hypothetical protein|nr:hypothetical protein [Thermoleophilaceae bacterium]
MLGVSSSTLAPLPSRLAWHRPPEHVEVLVWQPKPLTRAPTTSAHAAAPILRFRRPMPAR